MSLDRFNACLPRILAHEGGFVNDPADPGGATNLGVTLATARAYGLDKDHDGDVDVADVKALTAADVAGVYHRGYWLASSADICPPGLDYMVFDCAVNQGVGRAVKFLQRALNLADDGVIGPKSRAAIALLAEAGSNLPTRAAIEAYAKIRQAHYHGLPTFTRFGKGWMNRLWAVTSTALTEADVG